MTSLSRFSGLTAITLAAALSLSAGLAIAGDTVTADRILNALQPKPLTRGLSLAPPADPAAKARESSFIDSLRNPAQAWLTVAMASTLAGNLTVLGSIANLIVVQRAAASGVVIGLWNYCRVGVPLMLLTLLIGTLWLWV